MQAAATPSRPRVPSRGLDTPTPSSSSPSYVHSLGHSPAQPAAGPSTPGRLASYSASGAREGAGAPRDLWTDILRSADRQKALARKNVVLLSERHRGRAHLLDKIVGKRRAGRRPEALAIGYDLLMTDDRDEGACMRVWAVGPSLLSAEVVSLSSLISHALPCPKCCSAVAQTATMGRDAERGEGRRDNPWTPLTADSAPPVSVLYPPSSHPSLLRLVDVSLPPHPLPVR